MNRLRRALLLCAPSFLLACGGTEPTPDTVDENVFYAETGAFDVAPGDVFECFYTSTFTQKDLAVYDAIGSQGPGGHHLTVYWTDVTHAPEHHPCKDSEMVAWHQIAASGGETAATKEGLTALPDGLASRVPAGKQIVVQSHYINASGATEHVNDWIKLKLMDPSKVAAYVNYLATVDDKFDVPAHNTLSSTTVCTLERDYQIILHLGHMHEYGKHYKLEQMDDQGNSMGVLHDEDWRPEYASHPPVTYYTKDKPLLLTKGTRLRQTCTWDNTTADPLLFPREMCLAYFLYFPDDQGETICDMAPEAPAP